MEVRPIDANELKTGMVTDLANTIRMHEMHKGDMAVRVLNKIDEAPTISLNTLRDAIYQDAVAHGLWEEGDDLSDDLLDDCYDLICDEVSELDGAIEEWVRTGYHNHFAEELADVVIMCMSVAGKLGIDIDAAIKRKMEINKGRAWKHGKE